MNSNSLRLNSLAQPWHRVKRSADSLPGTVSDISPEECQPADFHRSSFYISTPKAICGNVLGTKLHLSRPSFGVVPGGGDTDELPGFEFDALLVSGCLGLFPARHLFTLFSDRVAICHTSFQVVTSWVDIVFRMIKGKTVFYSKQLG